MQFMFILKASEDSESGRMPRLEAMEAMRRYNDAMESAGILMMAEGLHPSAEGTRIKFSRTGVTLTDGPFSPGEGLVAGMWMIEVSTRESAMEWAVRAPVDEGAEIEVRPVYLAKELEALLPRRAG